LEIITQIESIVVILQHETEYEEKLTERDDNKAPAGRSRILPSVGTGYMAFEKQLILL
jgi:hypothetical protein